MIGWWWALGIIVFVTERWPVELEFRRSTHSFSLTDIPLTLALIFTSGTHAFVAVMAGALVALLLRRVPPVKFAFNLAQFALVTSRADRRRASGRLRRPGLRLDHVGRRARRGADRRAC